MEKEHFLSTAYQKIFKNITKDPLCEILFMGIVSGLAHTYLLICRCSKTAYSDMMQRMKQVCFFFHLKYPTLLFPEQTNHTAFISSCYYLDLFSICPSLFSLQSPFRSPLLSSLVTHMLLLQRCPDASNLQD